jgi:hypothetical protein
MPKFWKIYEFCQKLCSKIIEENQKLCSILLELKIGPNLQCFIKTGLLLQRVYMSFHMSFNTVKWS